MTDKKKILIVDDSKMIRKGLSEIFATSADFEVVGEAADGVEALSVIRQTQPDVVTLDVMMPGMDGLTTLKHIMIECPRPTVMLSSLTQDGSETTFDALRYGAVDFISKPSRLEEEDMDALASDIIKKLNTASDIDVGVTAYIRTCVSNAEAANSADASCEKLVALGAAEGGYRALMKIIPHLTPGNAAYLVVLYAEDEHIEAFASYLNEHSQLMVKRAENDEVLQAGICYISAGSDYMSVHHQEDELVLHV
ncbi:MAG: response regulator, partial [Gammaproteobacteria bacterium]|nr:response regulator [Gammaproteobacteria bacterium]